MTGYSIHQRLANILCIVALLISFPLAEPHSESPVQNPIFTVNTTADTLDSVPGDGNCADMYGKCSLRAAIQEANADNRQAYLVNLPAGTYVLTIPGVGEDNNATGDLDVHANLILTGAGVNQTVINAMALDRVLDIHPGASLTVQGVTITGGRTADVIAGSEDENDGDSEGGGGIYNAGTLTLRDSTVTANHTGAGGTSVTSKGGMAGNGGGIYNSGSLNLDHTDVLENNTGPGGTGGIPSSMAGGGRSGSGGGIYNVGWLRLDESNVINNDTGQGGNGGPRIGCDFCTGIGGESGDGGGIYNANSLWLKDSRITANATGPGGEGAIYIIYDLYVIQALGGMGGSGGGVYNTGYLWVETSEFSLNSTGAGGESAGSGGQGGGIYTTSWLEMRGSQVRDNAAGAGAGAGSERWTAGPGGPGGGIYNIGHLLIVGSLIEGNLSGSGGPTSGIKGIGGAGGPAGCGGGGFQHRLAFSG